MMENENKVYNGRSEKYYKYKDMIYTKDDTVKVPDGREFGNLSSALGAYNLDFHTFYHCLDEGYSIREAFVGKDYSCGLKFDNDAKVRDHNKKPFNSLIEMCEYHKADVVWFQKLYAVTNDLELSLKQLPEHKSDEFIGRCKIEKERELEKRKIAEEQAKKEEEEKAVLRNRLSRARKVLTKYCEFHLNSYKCFSHNRAVQIEKLCEFLSTYTTLTYDERRLYNKVLIALEAKTTVHSKTPDPNQKLVDSILLDFKKPVKKDKDTKNNKETKNTSSPSSNSKVDDSVKTSQTKNSLENNNNVEKLKVVKKKKVVDLSTLSSEELARREEIREKRAMAGRISAAKRKEQKLLASDKGLCLVETNKPNTNYSEVEEQTIKILESYLGKLNAF